MLDDQVSVILKTEDVPRTIEWYQRVGFRLRGVFPDTAEPTSCELSRDGVVCSSSAARLRGPSRRPSRARSTSIPKRGSAVRGDQGSHADGVGSRGARLGGRELGLRDPNGYFLTFTEEAEPGIDEAEGRPDAEAAP
jgi:hypothetical protein